MVLKNQIVAVLAGLGLAQVAYADPLVAQPVSVNQFAASVRASAYMPKATPRPVMAPTVAPIWPSAATQSARLSQGVLSRDFNPATAQATLEDVRASGLGVLRLKLDVFAHMSDQGVIDPAYLTALETTVNQAALARVPVILTEDNSAPCSKLPAFCAPLLKSVWSQLSARFQTASPDVMFELLSDPTEHLTADRWNVLQADLVATIRTTNPTRTLIVTPSSAPNLAALNSLRLPQDDQHLIVALGFDDLAATEIEPNEALLKIKLVRDSEALQMSALETRLGTLSQWALINERPLFLKDAGSKNPEMVKYRARWTTNLVRLASQMRLGWGLGEGASVLKVETIQQARALGLNAQMNAGLPKDLSAN